MPLPRKARPWAVLLSLVAFCYPAWSDQRLLIDPLPNDLVAPLESWLDAHLSYPRRSVPPQIEIIDLSTAREMRGSPGRMAGHPRGLYDPETSTIYLVAPWSRDDPSDVSVLLHELVHHRQTGARHFYCPGAQEPEAYALQERWLDERGLTLNHSRIAVVLMGGCTRGDMHPD